MVSHILKDALVNGAVLNVYGKFIFRPSMHFDQRADKSMTMQNVAHLIGWRRLDQVAKYADS